MKVDKKGFWETTLYTTIKLGNLSSDPHYITIILPQECDYDSES